MLLPLLNNPLLKKYGLLRPDFRVNRPNCNTSLRMAKSINLAWYSFTVLPTRADQET